YPLDRPALVEAEPAARARGRLQEPQLFIEMDRPDGLPGEPGEIADADEMAGWRGRRGHSEPDPYVNVRFSAESNDPYRVGQGSRWDHPGDGRPRVGCPGGPHF